MVNQDFEPETINGSHHMIWPLYLKHLVFRVIRDITSAYVN